MTAERVEALGRRWVLSYVLSPFSLHGPDGYVYRDTTGEYHDVDVPPGLTELETRDWIKDNALKKRAV